MGELRTIEIDFDVHKKIEMERKNFSESPNAVLRRLLKIGDDRFTSEIRYIPGRPWAGKGVTLPHGTEVQMDYNGRVHIGRIENGRWLVEGAEYKSPSAAAGGVALTKDGRKTSLDGWIYWRIKRPGDVNWTPISSLRPE